MKSSLNATPVWHPRSREDCESLEKVKKNINVISGFLGTTLGQASRTRHPIPLSDRVHFRLKRLSMVKKMSSWTPGFSSWPNKNDHNQTICFLPNYPTKKIQLRNKKQILQLLSRQNLEPSYPITSKMLHTWSFSNLFVTKPGWRCRKT